MQIEFSIIRPDKLGTTYLPFLKAECLMCESNFDSASNSINRNASPILGELTFSFANVHQILSDDKRIFLLTVNLPICPPPLLLRCGIDTPVFSSLQVMLEVIVFLIE